jgi:hypothetical protein
MPRAIGTPMDYSALGVKVEALEADFREVKDSILSLDAKIDKSISSLAHEVRSAITALSGQLTERQRTPWGVLISGAGFIVLVLGIFGGQALSPIQSDIKSIKDEMVPRAEINARSAMTERRFTTMESAVEQIQRRRYDELIRTIERLQNDLRAGHRPEQGAPTP